MRENKAVIFYHYNAMAINSNVLNPIPFINNDHENISSDKNTRGYTHIRAKRESRQRNNPKDIPLIPQLEKYQAPSQINSFKDIQADRNFVLECDQMTVISPHELNSDPKPSIFKIPGRCRQVVKINLIHTTLREGYLPRIPTNPNIIIGECVVTNQNDSFQVLALNTSYEDVEVKIPSQKIVEYNCLSDIFGSSSEEEANPTLRLEDRIEKMLQILDTKHLNEEEQQHVRSLVTEYPDRFILPGDPLPCTNLVEHEIPTTDNIPINTKQYGPPPIHKKVAQEDVEKKLRDGIIEPSNSPMNSPMRIVPKKTAPGQPQKWRAVIDFRKLNEKTIGDAYPLPNVADILDQLGGLTYFSTFDLASGFHQIPVKETDRWKTAFSTLQGHYQYIRMPMGLKSAPSTFQRLMDNVLRGLQDV
uniref:Reverse transcriptase domain-containing protein n=1 Tax=Trichogramma kaykai TaxID=54128 RepID=A0ABD2W550_9HYME